MENHIHKYKITALEGGVDITCACGLTVMVWNDRLSVWKFGTDPARLGGVEFNELLKEVVK